MENQIANYGSSKDPSKGENVGNGIDVFMFDGRESREGGQRREGRVREVRYFGRGFFSSSCLCGGVAGVEKGRRAGYILKMLGSVSGAGEFLTFGMPEYEMRLLDAEEVSMSRGPAAPLLKT